MDEVIEASKKFVSENKGYVLIDLGFGIQVITIEFMGATWNKTKCTDCDSENCFKVWGVAEKKWIYICPECIKERH